MAISSRPKNMDLSSDGLIATTTDSTPPVRLYSMKKDLDDGASKRVAKVTAWHFTRRTGSVCGQKRGQKTLPIEVTTHCSCGLQCTERFIGPDHVLQRNQPSRPGIGLRFYWRPAFEKSEGNVHWKIFVFVGVLRPTLGTSFSRHAALG